MNATGERIEGLFDAPIPFRALADTLPVGLLLLDRERRVVFLNRTLEALLGFDLEFLRGSPCRDALRSDLCDRECPVDRADRSDGPILAKGRLSDRTRRRVEIHLSATALRDASGRTVGYVETVEDVSPSRAVDHELMQELGFGSLLGRSAAMRELFRIIPVIAETDSSVLVTGETGTGKDLLAEAIHEASGRKRGPFIKVNCGALPDTLLESELFGHVRGAFTGAVGDKPGRIRLAQGGTLYLTEIGDLPLLLQVKLLTFLDDKVVYPLGGTRGFQAEVRIVAATHRDLERMVEEGRFREDLLYRLNVVRLHLPPLRERQEDVGLLLDHFLRLFSGRFGKSVRRLSDRVRNLLLAHAYPGNVRELRNIVEYATNLCQGEALLPEHLPAYLLDAPEVPFDPPANDAALSGGVPPGLDPRTVDWSEIERRLIVDALVRTRGRRGRAADILGWGRSTLWRKMKQYDIDG